MFAAETMLEPEDYFRKLDESYISWRSPSSLTVWPVMDELYVKKLQEKDLKKILNKILENKNKIILTRSFILPSSSSFQSWAKEVEKNWLTNSYALYSVDLKEVFKTM
eukprot:snap_masked-scaffold_3-processed-gene-3.19-mRNA-1 protein AED:1.00 eAED:1.00 QI:0/0/0/0/1/1/2/0/107